MISNGKYLRKFLISGVAVGASDKINSTKCDQVCRASELPIYMSEEVLERTETELCPPKPGILEQTFGTVRKQIWSIFDQYKVYRKQTEDYIQDTTSQASSLLKYLSEETDDKTRYGVIGLGAITGYVLGMRGGLFRRLIYSSTAAFGMCSLCYPKQTADYTKLGIAHSRKYSTIAYNFIRGVKKEGDNEEEFLAMLPKLPSSLDEAWHMAGELGKSASSLISGGSTTTQQQESVSNEDISKPKE